MMRSVTNPIRAFRIIGNVYEPYPYSYMDVALFSAPM